MSERIDEEGWREYTRFTCSRSRSVRNSMEDSSDSLEVVNLVYCLWILKMQLNTI